MHMLLLCFAIATAMLLYWHVLLPLLPRVFVLLLLSCCAAVLELLAARPKVKRRDLQTGQNLWGGGYRSSYLACGAVGVRRSPAENADATDPPPGHSGPRLLARIITGRDGGTPEMAPSLRRAIFFRPGANSAGTSREMGQDRTELCGNIAPQSSEPTDSM